MKQIITLFDKNVILLFLLLLFSNLLHGQTIVWQEDFTYSDNTVVGTGNRWNTVITGSPNYIKVLSNELRGNFLVEEQVFETESINISAYSKVDISVDLRTVVLGNMEDADYIKVYYILDGGPETLFSINGSNINDLNPITASQTSLSGTTLEIRIRLKNSAIDETYGIDNVLVIEQPPAFFDSDNDGIDDNIDIDDDNDGIKDIDEEITCRLSPSGTTATYKFLNETFGTGSRTTINTTYNATTTYCYEDGTVGTNTGSCPSLSSKILDDGEYCVVSKITGTVASDPENIHGDLAWYQGADHTGDTDGRMAVFNASFTPGVFYETTITGVLSNMPITYSFWALNIMAQSTFPGSILPDITVQFLDTSNNVLTSINTGQFGRCSGGITDNSCENGVWKQFTTSVNLGNVNEFIVRFINNAPGGGGNDLAIDDILISQTLCDADKDGVADLFDLDSDNDGIPDVVECGNGQYSNGTAKIPTGVWVDANSNGMHDAAESTVALDSDGDGVPNYLDLDSDNDTIFDVDESGAGNTADANFQNGDGDINGDGVGDGTDSDAFRETDINSDSILEYFTDGILDAYDFFEGGTFSTSYGNQSQGASGVGWDDYVIDTDNDGTPDYIDTTSNGSTFDIDGTLYSSLDTDSNGIIDDSTDSDGDGIVNLFDTDDAIFGSPRDLNQKLHLYFDGRNDYTEDSSVIDGWSEASIMGWIKIDPTATGSQIILGQDQFYLELKADKKIEINANGTIVSNTTALNTNQWIHLAGTYSNSNSKLKLYVNGQIIDSTNVTGALPTDTSSFTIGRKPNTNSNYFKGYFDEIRVFNKELSENELHKIIYQEIENNSGVVRGSVIPLDVSNYVNTTTDTPLTWTFLKRYFRMDTYKDDIIDDLTTATIDAGSGAKIYNVKIIDVQSAPLPFITQIGDTTLPNSVDIPSDGVLGTDATTYDWSIVKIEHKNITHNTNQKHLGLFVNSVDASSNPIEFSIKNDSELNISWYLKLDGFIDLENESQLIQGIESVLDDSSSGYIERDQQGVGNKYRYNDWSSPVLKTNTAKGSTFTIADILKDGTNPSLPGTIAYNNSGYDGATIPMTLSTYWMYKYVDSPYGDYSSWEQIRSSGNLTPGDGFLMKGTGAASDQNYVFKGKPNNGDISINISPDNGYLVGNPYPSALDADQFINDNSTSITGTIYFWEHYGGESHILAEYQAGYATYNLSGGIAAASPHPLGDQTAPTAPKMPERYIPVAQGFFAQGDSDGGIIVFNNGQRTFVKESSGSSIFMKGIKSKKESNLATNTIEEDDRPKIRLGFDAPKIDHRQLLLTIDKKASESIDYGYDGEVYELFDDDMFWIIEDEKYVIQGTNEISLDTEIPIGIQSEGGNISINIDQIENFSDDTEFFIKDNLTDETFKINDQQFKTYLEAGEYRNRFVLAFQPKLKSINEIKLIDGISIYMNNNSSRLNIKKLIDVNIESINLYNYLGQMVQTWNQNLENRNLWLSLKSNNSGLFIVQLNTEHGEIIKKIIIN